MEMKRQSIITGPKCEKKKKKTKPEEASQYC